MDKPVNFLRYPGSKRRMISFLSSHLPDFSKIEGKYVEPFLGSGAVFLSILPKESILSDLNNELINIYLGIRNKPDSVWRIYRRFGDTKKDYYYVRDRYKPYSIYGQAARSLYLNRTCFKGMWRHNNNGKFNVGYGGQNRRWVINLQTLRSISKALNHTEILCCDFEETLDKCKKGDFVFCDPPYKPGECDLINVHYTCEKFSFFDHQRLANKLMDLSNQGIFWVLTISSHKQILKLFKNNYVLDFAQGTGGMPGKLVKNSGEVLITNYKIQGGVEI